VFRSVEGVRRVAVTVVLVIDDDESFALVRRICERAGLVAVHAADCATARQVVVKHQPAVVFTSRSLPGEDGLVWIAELRLKLPNALITVASETRDLTVMDAGADLVISRPLDEQSVASALQAAAAVDRAEPTRRLAILIIEPDPHLAVVMKRWLGGAYDVTLVSTGWRAIEEIRRWRPDAVLAELRLPDMDATELFAAIDKEAPGLADLTLFMTAGFVADKAQQFLARIPGQWIYKPFDLAKLRAAINELVA
jgi:DNA-binding response OmpR family regulator